MHYYCFLRGGVAGKIMILVVQIFRLMPTILWSYCVLLMYIFHATQRGKWFNEHCLWFILTSSSPSSMTTVFAQRAIFVFCWSAGTVINVALKCSNPKIIHQVLLFDVLRKIQTQGGKLTTALYFANEILDPLVLWIWLWTNAINLTLTITKIGLSQ